MPPISHLPNVTIRPMELADSGQFEQALEILNRTQGRDLFAPNYLSEIVRNPDALVVGGFQNGSILGLGIAQIISDFDYYLPFDSNIGTELSGKKVGSFSTLAVAESYQGTGIGQKISRARLQWLIEKGCTTVLGVSWVSGLKHTSHRVFEKLGFQAVSTVHDFYQASSIQSPFDCPGCRKAPCSCAAILYRWNSQS